MYQSLYRTWRPRTFSQMVGQVNLVRTLKNQATTGHIAHAYLFSGSRGTGKTSAARILAMAINCLDLQAGDPCLQCEACQALIKDTTLDIFEMDAASNSRVEEIREMLEKVNYPPQSVRYKVYIIDEVHMLSNAAFNALLKTLEEPPRYMVFILATTEPQKIPATILSRCQRFDFGRIREEDIVARLKVALSPGQQVEEEALALIAASAEGSMRDAWSLMDMCLGADNDLNEARVRAALGTVDKGFMFAFAAALASGDAALCFRMIRQMLQSGKDIQVFLKDISLHLRRLIAAQLGAGGDLTGEAALRYQDQAAAIPLDKLVWMLEKAARAEADLRWTSQQRTVLEVLALSLCRPGGEDDTQALQVRVADLERLLASRADVPGMAPPPEPRPPVAEAVRPPAAPPAPAAEAAAPLREQSPKDAWNAMLKRAARELPSVYSMMSEGKYGGFRDDCFLLNYPEDKQFLSGFLMADDRRQRIEALLSQESGRPVRFQAAAFGDRQQEVDQKQKARQDIQQLSEVFGRQNITVKGDV
ncbi:MAG: DNA polymerase III subunit gamma/tau [Christensenellales bacterium]